MKSNSPHIKPPQKNESKHSNQGLDAVDEKSATFIKESSDLLIDIRDVLAANKISNPTEHQRALKRIEQFWQAKPGTDEGKELNVLAEIVCKYEEKIFS